MARWGGIRPHSRQHAAAPGLVATGPDCQCLLARYRLRAARAAIPRRLRTPRSRVRADGPSTECYLDSLHKATFLGKRDQIRCAGTGSVSGGTAGFAWTGKDDVKALKR